MRTGERRRSVQNKRSASAEYLNQFVQWRPPRAASSQTIKMNSSSRLITSCCWPLPSLVYSLPRDVCISKESLAVLPEPAVHFDGSLFRNEKWSDSVFAGLLAADHPTGATGKITQGTRGFWRNVTLDNATAVLLKRSQTINALIFHLWVTIYKSSFSKLCFKVLDQAEYRPLKSDLQSLSFENYIM